MTIKFIITKPPFMTSFTGGKTLNIEEVKEAGAISIDIHMRSKTVLSQSIYFRDTMTGINFDSEFKTHEYIRNSMWDYKNHVCYGFKITKKQQLPEYKKHLEEVLFKVFGSYAYDMDELKVYLFENDLIKAFGYDQVTSDPDYENL